MMVLTKSRMVSTAAIKLVVLYKHEAPRLQAICLVFVLYLREKGHRENQQRIRQLSRN